MGLSCIIESCKKQRSYHGVLKETLKKLTEVADKTTYDPLEKFTRTLIEYCENGLLPTHAELGYFNNMKDFGYSYFAVLIPYEYAETVREYACDEEFKTYICDEASEREMWSKDKENPEIAFTKEHRKGTNITCDIENEYVNIMFLRYPTDCLTELDAKELEEVTNKYIWVQVKPVVFGEKSLAVSAYADGLLNAIKSGSNSKLVNK